MSGRVTRLGWPYNPKDVKKGHFRYVEVKDAHGFKHRVFYIAPKVEFGQYVQEGDVIGVAQTLQGVYPGITNHVHYEIKDVEGGYLDPTGYV